jgi:Chromate transporter
VSSFGGPVAHIGYFRQEFVIRRRWLDERAYADIVALCQFLPGPASSQTGFSLALMRAGYLGGLAAWTGFTLPSAIALVLFAYGATALAGTDRVGPSARLQAGRGGHRGPGGLGDGAHPLSRSRARLDRGDRHVDCTVQPLLHSPSEKQT